jgi:hypothetical protein
MNNIHSSSRAQDDVDSLLQSFFKKQMPDPWPDASWAAPGASVPGSWLHTYGRLGLVASVALFLFSYIALAARFPAQPDQVAPGLSLNRNQTIGLKQRVPTPHGGEALLWEETIPATRGKPPTIIINVQEIKGPEKR